MLAVKYNPNGQSLLSLVALPSSRKMDVLGRYLRQEYREVMDDIQDIELSKDEREMLVAIYSTGDMEGLPLASIPNKEASEVELLRKQMEGKGLVVDGEGGLQLTPAGRVVVDNHLEDVNQ